MERGINTSYNLHMKHDRHRLGCLRWLALPALLLALVYIGAAVRIFNTPPALAAQLAIPVTLLGSISLLWALLFGVVGVLLWWGRPNALVYSAGWVIGFVLIETLLPVAFAQADYARQRLPFRLITAALIAIIPLVYLVGHAVRRGDRHGEQ